MHVSLDGASSISGSGLGCLGIIGGQDGDDSSRGGGGGGGGGNDDVTRLLISDFSLPITTCYQQQMKRRRATNVNHSHSSSSSRLAITTCPYDVDDTSALYNADIDEVIRPESYYIVKSA